jgi:hypothetical protein
MSTERAAVFVIDRNILLLSLWSGGTPNTYDHGGRRSRSHYFEFGSERENWFRSSGGLSVEVGNPAWQERFQG